MINKFEKKVLDTIRKFNMITPGDNIIACVSGGADSMALLNSLLNLKNLTKYNELIVCHVNHMLRKEAEEETKFVKDFCEDNNIRCFVKYVDINAIAKENKIGLEEAGRIERYKFFDEIAKKEGFNKIAVAHNKKDNSETVLMHLLRGSGLNGLTGIHPVRDNFIRPIIKCTREEIEEYLKEENIEFKVDKTNSENDYTRNKIRNELIPYLEKEYNENIVDSLDRLSEIASEEQEFIKSEIERNYSKCLKKANETSIELDLKKFNLNHRFIRKQIAIHTITSLLGNSTNIAKVNIDDIVELAENNVGNKNLFPNKNIKVYIKSGIIYFYKLTN